MSTALISSKGQLTLPAEARRKLGLKPRSRVEVQVKEQEIVIRPIKSVGDLYGVLNEYAKGKTQDWETVRTLTEKAIAEEVVNEDKR